MAPPPPTPSPARSQWRSRLRTRSTSTGKKEKRGSVEKEASKANGSGGMKEKAKRPVYDEQTTRCAKVSLDCWNRNQKPQGLSDYVVVKPMYSCGFTYSCNHMYHANFTARPKNDPSAEPELFFAELKGNISKKTNHDVPLVCSLGPMSSVTAALNGCRACGSVGTPDPSLCHPEGGFCLGNPVYFLEDQSVLRTKSLPWELED